MIKFVATGLFFLSLAIVSPRVYGAEKKWKDDGEISYVDTSGNTDVSTLSVKNTLKYKFNEEIEGTWKAGVLYGETSGVKTAESYLSELRVDHLFSDHLYAAVIAGWIKDKFAGIDPRYYVGPAIGYKVLLGPKHFLKTEAGVDYVNEEYTNNTKADFERGRAFVEYEYEFSETNRFVQSVEFLSDFDDSDNYNMNTITSLISSLNQYFSLKTRYEIRKDNKPVPATLNNTDTTLSLSLLASF